MEQYQRARRAGQFAILCAILIRLTQAGLPMLLAESWQALWQTLFRPEQAAAPVAPIAPNRPLRTYAPESPQPVSPQADPPAEKETAPVFTEADFSLLSLTDEPGKGPDLEALLLTPAELTLTAPGPRVLILHTHTTESYTPDGESYVPSAPYRTLDEDHNLLSLGDQLTEALEAGGITAIHDRVIHDYPSYNTAYAHSRKTAQGLLLEYPTIQLVLDLHRDAVEVSGRQLRTKCTVDGQPAAQIMLVVGTGSNGLSHPNWQKNLALAAKLHVLLERENPGIMRPIDLRRQRFNQDLSPGALIIEVGAAGNTRQEAMRAVEALAKAILALPRQ